MSLLSCSSSEDDTNFGNLSKCCGYQDSWYKSAPGIWSLKAMIQVCSRDMITQSHDTSLFQGYYHLEPWYKSAPEIWSIRAMIQVCSRDMITQNHDTSQLQRYDHSEPWYKSSPGIWIPGLLQVYPSQVYTFTYAAKQIVLILLFSNISILPSHC